MWYWGFHATENSACEFFYDCENLHSEIIGGEKKVTTTAKKQPDLHGSPLMVSIQSWSERLAVDLQMFL